MTVEYDVIVIGAGPAGSTAAIRLAQAGWSVALVEKHAFPRRKVCGECIAATNLPLLDALGVGARVDALAGHPLHRVGLFAGKHQFDAAVPHEVASTQPWGRALGREHLDTLLLERAAAVGVSVWQPWTVERLQRDGDRHLCRMAAPESDVHATLSGALLIAAHGSWEPNSLGQPRKAHRPDDLFGFKASFHDVDLAPGLLPVLAFPGGYGGIVQGDHGRATLAFCIRRDALRESRDRYGERSAALAAAAHVQASCQGVRWALAGAARVAPWLGAGPIRPGSGEPWRGEGIFAVGDAAGEAHPILGDGIGMALQSSWLLCNRLGAQQDILRGKDAVARAKILERVGRDYATAWRRSFASRMRVAEAFAQLAARAGASRPSRPLLRQWPDLLSVAGLTGVKLRHVRQRAGVGGAAYAYFRATATSVRAPAP